MSPSIDLSIIVPVTEGRFDDVQEVYSGYKQAIESTGYNYEIIYVIDGPYPEVSKKLCSLVEGGEKCLTVIKLAKGFGEATALKVGFENSNGS